MTPNQEQRQKREYRKKGRYAKVHPCCICSRSAGVNYFSHRDTDSSRVVADRLLVLCVSCYNKTSSMTGVEAIEWAKRHYPATFEAA